MPRNIRICSIREAEVNGRAFADLRLGPDAPAVALDDALRDRQTDPGAFELLCAVEALTANT